LTITDEEDQNATDSVTVTVSSNGDLKKPVPVITVDKTEVFTNESVHFDANDSYDLDNEIVSYIWENNGTLLSHLVSFSHSFDTAGNYPITLTVMDADSQRAHTTIVIHVQDAAVSDIDTGITSENNITAENNTTAEDTNATAEDNNSTSEDSNSTSEDTNTTLLP
jgi:hypothetical protein